MKPCRCSWLFETKMLIELHVDTPSICRRKKIEETMARMPQIIADFKVRVCFGVCPFL